MSIIKGRENRRIEEEKRKIIEKGKENKKGKRNFEEQRKNINLDPYTPLQELQPLLRFCVEQMDTVLKDLLLLL